MKPIFLKAGIPIAVSVAGFIYSLITSRRDSAGILEDGQEFDETDNSQFADSTSLRWIEDEEYVVNPQAVIKYRIQYRPTTEEMVFGLMNKVTTLQHRERDLEMRFLFYVFLKEHELAFTKVENTLVLEQAFIDYQRVLKQHQSTRLQNKMLRKKVKTLLRITRRSSILQARRGYMVVELNKEIMGLKRLVNQLQEEKREFTKNFSEESDQMKLELEQLRKERAEEAEEMIYLRWINACFRHEVTRNRVEQQGNSEEMGRYDSENCESCAFVVTTTSRHKKPKLLNKLRQWAKGSRNEKEHSDSAEAAEKHVKARWSCSSA
ncbi:hypothetical protein ACHQM5_009914 [Ranunculus cassubicifolius]